MTLSWTRNNQGQCKPCNTVVPSLSLSLSQKSFFSPKHGFLCSLESKLVHNKATWRRFVWVHSFMLSRKMLEVFWIFWRICCPSCGGSVRKAGCRAVGIMWEQAWVFPFLFLAKVRGCACQCEDAISVAQPARLLQNCTELIWNHSAKLCPGRGGCPEIQQPMELP